MCASIHSSKPEKLSRYLNTSFLYVVIAGCFFGWCEFNCSDGTTITRRESNENETSFVVFAVAFLEMAFVRYKIFMFCHITFYSIMVWRRRSVLALPSAISLLNGNRKEKVTL